MKCMKYGCLAILACGVMWAGTASLAADQPHTNVGTLSDKDLILDTGKLMQLDVYNSGDHNLKLGNIQNLLISAHTGQVLYGILDIGVGGKVVAVPWKALQLTKMGDDKHGLVLNKSKDDLANAPAFDINNWPDFSNNQWSQSVDNFFGVKTSIDHGGVGGLTANQLIFLADNLGDLDVYHRGDISIKLGNVDNLVVKADTGEVLYAVVDTGIVGKTIAVPWIAFHLQKAANRNQYWLTLNKSKDDLNSAPTIETDRIADVAADPKWQQDTANFFGVRTVARPKQ